MTSRIRAALAWRARAAGLTWTRDLTGLGDAARRLSALMTVEALPYPGIPDDVWPGVAEFRRRSAPDRLALAAAFVAQSA